jgi:hypothetical protein
MGGAVPPLPNTPSWHGAELGGAQGRLLHNFARKYRLIFIKYYFSLRVYSRRFKSTQS